jgi:hypothetical protein
LRRKTYDASGTKIAVIGGLLVSGDAFGAVPEAELGQMIRDVVHGILMPPAVS